MSETSADKVQIQAHCPKRIIGRKQSLPELCMCVDQRRGWKYPEQNFKPWSWQNFGSYLSGHSSSSQTHGDTGSETGAVFFVAWIFFFSFSLPKKMYSIPYLSGSFKRWSPRPLPPPHCSASPKSLNFIEHHNACALYFVSTSPTPLTTH